MTAEQRVDVCICTYRRASLHATLRSVAAQRVPPRTRMRVIVADNDLDRAAERDILATGRALDLELSYVHAPARNISVARNACLDAVGAPLIAFLDDDEIASPGWLAALLARMADTGAAIVLGPATALYPADAPAWLARADLHSTRPAIRADGSITSGYTCNVLFRADIIAGLRFDPALGRTGGEDDIFFSALHRAGHVIAYAPDAAVSDPVPADRARLGWLLRRSFRNGQTYGQILRASGQSRARALALSALKAGFCGASALARIGSPAGWRRAVVRGALHAGAVARLSGKRDIELY